MPRGGGFGMAPGTGTEPNTEHWEGSAPTRESEHEHENEGVIPQVSDPRADQSVSHPACVAHLILNG